MKSTSNEIEYILQGCRKQNRDAQKKLYQFYYSFAMGICMRYAENKDDAVEIMNDGYLRVFKYISNHDKDQPFIPWFKRILINSAIDHYHKRNKQPVTVLLEDTTIQSMEGTIMDTISYDEMLGLVRQLPDAYRAVFNLIAIEGFKHQEVAKMLHISVGTSKSNYSRARQKLQDYLQSYFQVR